MSSDNWTTPARPATGRPPAGRPAAGHGMFERAEAVGVPTEDQPTEIRPAARVSAHAVSGPAAAAGADVVRGARRGRSAGSNGPTGRGPDGPGPGGRGPGGTGAGGKIKKRKRTGWRRFVPSWKWFLGGFVLIVLAGFGAFAAAYSFTVIPKPNQLVTAQTSIVYWNDGKTELGRLSEQNRISLPLEQIPQNVQDAVISAEDRTFWTNQGVSPRGIVRAAISNAKGGATQGASTITQQYVKNYYLTQERTLSRKVQEFFVSLKIDRTMDKKTILEDYLNTIYFGRGAYGVQTASQAYFGKDVSQLSKEEAATLASVIRSPGLYDPRIQPSNGPRLLARMHYVLGGMAAKGQYDAAAALTAPLPAIAEYKKTNYKAGMNGYLLQAVESELEANKVSEDQINTGGLRIVSTLDPNLQNQAQAAVKAQFPKTENDQVHAALSAVRPGTGEVLAMYGGDDFLTQPYDYSQAYIKAGSTVKAFTLLTGLQNGISLKSGFQGNTPIIAKVAKQPINNELNTTYPYKGCQTNCKVDLVRATAESINTAFVDLTDTVGVEKVRATLQSVGLSGAGNGSATADFQGSQEALTLGTFGVTSTQMAAAYASIASGGVYAPHHVVKTAKDTAGKTLYDGAAVNKAQKLFPDDVIADATYALQQVVVGQGGSGAKAKALGRDVAGKTGTATGNGAALGGSSDTVSGWFAGFTPQLAVAVDYFKGDATSLGTGNLDGTGTEPPGRFFGANYPTQTWTAFMKTALQGQPKEKFARPVYLGDVVNPISSPTPPPATQAPVVPVPQQPVQPTQPTQPTQPPQPPQPQQQGIPNTKGARQGEAVQTLRQAGFQVNVQQVDVTDRNQDGVVQGQDPGGGQAAPGATVTIIVGNFKKGQPSPTPPGIPAPAGAGT